MAYQKQTWRNLPERTTPITAARLEHMETQYDEAVSYTDGEIGSVESTVNLKADQEYVDGLFDSISTSRGSLPQATIKHVEAPSYSYEVIRVTGGFGSIRKIQPEAVSPTGTIPSSQALTPRQMSEEVGYPSITNGDALAVSGGTYSSVGLQIIDGEAVKDFGVQSGDLTGSDEEALILMRDGSLQPARKSDGLTAEDYVGAGAFASFGYGPILVENGVDTLWYQNSKFSGFYGSVSARTVLGQNSRGDYIIILVDGKTGAFGISGKTITDIALEEGCEIAVNLDGGGTTQALWKNTVIHPSTDSSGERESMSFIAILAPTTQEYDSGEIPLPPTSGVSSSVANPLSLRQVGPEITLQLAANFNPSITDSAWKVLSETSIPIRYRAKSDEVMKGVVYGAGGRTVGVSASSGVYQVNVRLSPGQGTSNAALGSIKWRSQFAE